MVNDEFFSGVKGSLLMVKELFVFACSLFRSSSPAFRCNLFVLKEEQKGFPLQSGLGHRFHFNHHSASQDVGFGMFIRHFLTPFFNLGCVPAGQDWYFPAFVFGRSGINRRRKQVVLKTIGQGRGLVAQNAGNQSNQSIREHRSAQFPPLST
jgi:hypothetical protein